MFVGQDPSGVAKLGMGCFSGGVAAFCSNPIEVTLVRMQADGRLPLAQRRNYSNMFNGLCRIGSEDGAKAYMAGVVPAMLRAMIVNMLQVRSYDDILNTYVARTHTHAYIYACMHACTQLCVHVHTHTHMDICKYIYVHVNSAINGH